MCFGGKQSRFDLVKKQFPTAHIERAKHPRAAFDYCCKSETRVGENYQFGKPPILRNNKLDRAELNKQIINNGPEWAVDEGLINVGEYKRFKISVELYKSTVAQITDIPELVNEWVHGDPGVGKSKYARSLGPIFNKSCNKWWDGYAGQDIVVIDDLGLDHRCLGHYIKIWADHYAFGAEIKNGKIQIRPKKIIVTSNYTPKEIWKDDDQMVNAIVRRFNFKLITFD